MIRLNAQQAQQILDQLNYDKEHEENEQIIRGGIHIQELK